MENSPHNPLEAIPPSIEEFLVNYCDAFNRLNPEEISQHYATPCGIAQNGEYFHFANTEHIVANNLKLCDWYRQQKYLQAKFEVLQWLNQGMQHAVVDVAWIIEHTPPLTPTRFQTTYNLIKSPAGWRIQLCTAYQENFS